jgi:hypothetical protein
VGCIGLLYFLLLLGDVVLYILKYTDDDVSTSRHNGVVNTVCNFNVNGFEFGSYCFGLQYVYFCLA